MSSIDKLSIRGIRSFGHEDHDRQVIEFFHPLTLITGHNGAGKTTVIESLRYITTGETPPLAKSAAFIHDPKVAHETSVKAQVKLSFKDVSDKRVVVTRNVEATQKLKNIQTKTLEGVISRMNDYGEKTSLSSKCAEIDREMVESLGVSKAVLNNVIFCHQEDSNWPLGEGRSLKIKFDEIFAATRYIKALDNMTKFRKEQNQTIGNYKVEVKYLKEYKEKSRQLKDNCDEKKTQLAAAKDSVNRIKEQIVPIEEKIREIDAQDEEVASRCTELEKLKAEKKQMQRNMKDLEDGLEQLFQGSVEELRRIYKEHKETLEQKQVTLKQNEKQLSKTRKDAEGVNKQKSRLLLQQGKLEQEEKQYGDTVTKRNKKINQAAQELNIPGYDELGDDSQIQDFVQILDDKAKKQEKDVASCKQSYEEQESVLDKQIQGLRDEKTKLQHTVQTKTETMRENKSKMKKIADDLSKMDASAQRLPELEEDLKRAERNLEEVQNSVDVDKLKEEIQGLQAEKKEKESTMSKLSKEMSALSMQSKARTQLEMLQKDKNSKEDQIRKIRGRHEEEVIRLMGHFPTSNMRGKLSDFIVQKQSEIKDVTRKLDKAKGEMSSLKANKKMRTEELKKLQDELNTSRETLLEVCDDEDDLDQSVQNLQQSINNLQSEKGALTGSTHLFERYIRTLEKDDAMCPLCHRGFDERPEVDELVQQLRDKLRLAPSKLQEKERALTQQRDKLDRLRELKPVKDKMSKLSDGEIPNVKSKLTTINSSIDKLQQSILEQESALSFLQEEERTANDMKPDIWQMERCQGELKELERKIATQSVQLSGTDASRTIQKVNSERQSLELSLDHVSRTLEQRQQQLEEQTERVQVLQASINSITSEKLRLTMMVQQEEKLQEQQAELKVVNQTYQREIKEAKDQLQPVENRLSELSEEKSDLLMQKETEIEELKFKISKLREKKNEIASLTSDINRYLNSGTRDKLENCEQDMKEIQTKLDKLEQQQSKLTDSINQIQEDLARQEVHERELTDNLQLRKRQKEVEEVDRQIATVEEQLAGYDTRSLKAEKRRLNNEYSKLFKDRNHAEGRQVILLEDVKKLEKELREDSYRDADTKYQDMMINLRTTEIANQDLEKYCKALDKAIMSYHGLKMSEINKIIRDLWRMTYKGNDIDYIEIRSEDDTGAGQARRTYHYRVVMVKGDTSLDMRGRCSAGQKVLASLIIRLALAETFCLNCGILALDEPTTNLDKDNIESLAHALVDIIKSREGQRNFQLIVITHDEDFVELLGRSDYTDYFYRIQKNDEYKSVVRRLNIESLQNVTEID